jgi:hypothetical protein
VDASYADIAMVFNCKGTHFKQNANFNRIRLGESALFDSKDVNDSVENKRTLFEGSVDFVGANIGGNFQADNADFKNSEQPVTFNSMKVGHSVHVIQTIFEGPVDFISAEIGGNFEAMRAQFKSGDKEANFGNMKVKRDGLFSSATFEAPVIFGRAEIGGLFAANKTQFQNKSTSFEDMKVDVLRFDDATFPNSFYLNGLSYHTISAPSGTDLLNLIGRSEYSVDVYARLEAFWSGSGHQDWANKTYIAQKRRERRERLDGPRWFGSLFLDVFVGYGRRPWLALIWSAGFVMLGWFAFRQEQNMVLQKKEDCSRRYNAIWYSIDVFAPVIDLGAAKTWMPNPDYRFAWYENVLRILGWILIPIGLAAWTGIIK